MKKIVAVLLSVCMLSLSGSPAAAHRQRNPQLLKHQNLPKEAESASSQEPPPSQELPSSQEAESAQETEASDPASTVEAEEDVPLLAPLGHPVSDGSATPDLLVQLSSLCLRIFWTTYPIKKSIAP